MPTRTITASATIGGVQIGGALSRTGVNNFGAASTTPLAAGKPGQITTRTDNNTGVVTLSPGHGITTGMIIDLYWDGGSRRGMTTVVATNAVTIDLGAGDNLPALNALVVLCQQTVIDDDFTGDNCLLAMASATRRCQIVFQQNDGTEVKAIDLGKYGNDGEYWSWATSSDVTNPFAGVSVGKVTVSNGDGVNTCSWAFGGVLV